MDKAARFTLDEIREAHEANEGAYRDFAGDRRAAWTPREIADSAVEAALMRLRRAARNGNRPSES